MRVAQVFGAIALASLFTPCGHAQSRSFDIYWVDVEGGAATLVVSPSGESLLYDAGWENDDRDAKRIFAVARQAGVSRIDHFVLSHFHADHAGGMVALSKLMPFGHCYDRGDFIEPENQRWRDAYLSVCKDKRTILKAGDTIPLQGIGVDVVASNGELIKKPLAGRRPQCAVRDRRASSGGRPREPVDGGGPVHVRALPVSRPCGPRLGKGGGARVSDRSDRAGHGLASRAARGARRRGCAGISRNDQAAARRREQRAAQGSRRPHGRGQRRR